VIQPRTTSSSNPIGTELIRKALSETPELPSQTIARHLLEQNPAVWRNLDAVRQAVRYARGAHGNANRKHRGNGFKAPPSPLTNSVSVLRASPFYIPPNEENQFLPHFVSAGTKNESILVLSDLHFPYHSVGAIRIAIEEARKRDVTCIILNGDQLDFHQLSRFIKDPRRRDPASEIECCKQFLESLREHFPKARIIWKDGNHDERYVHYLMLNAEKLFGIREFRLEMIVGLPGLGIEYVTDKRPIAVGKLSVLHGHEFAEPTIAPVNAARWLFLRAKANSACGHFHHSSEHIENTLEGKTLGSWSLGCLCELHPNYRPFNKWNHGFAFVTLAPSADFEVENKKIINGRCM
jgi:predicted phosphodiesterase